MWCLLKNDRKRDTKICVINSYISHISNLLLFYKGSTHLNLFIIIFLMYEEKFTFFRESFVSNTTSISSVKIQIQVDLNTRQIT